MDTLANIRTAVQDDLTVGEESTLFSPSVIDRAINRAYRKVGGLFPWPELQDAKKTVTQVNQEYYDYPQNWRSNSIWKLSITNSDAEEERYGEDPDGSPLSFDDYLNWKEDYPDSTDKKWANQWRRFFDKKGKRVNPQTEREKAYAATFEPKHKQKELFNELDRNRLSVLGFRVDLKTKLLIPK